MKNVLEWLETAAKDHGDQIVYKDQKHTLTFRELRTRARAVGAYIIEHHKNDDAHGPIAVFGSRSAMTPALFLGVVYSGRAYAPLDSTLPEERLRKILNQMKPAAILVDEETAENVEKVLAPYAEEERVPVYLAEEILKGRAVSTEEGRAVAEDKEQELLAVQRSMTSYDPLYIIYTSGSTGIPKGVCTSHDSLIRYIEAYCSVMGIDETDRLGNQSPLDYIAAIRDIYLPLKTGCQTVIIPKEYFMQPDRLFTYMNEQQVTSVGWSVSAFTIPLSLGAFEDEELTTLKKICFSGSVMPGKCLRKWQEHLPNAKFVNQYGPTEATASCTYYVVDHQVAEDEVLPIGEPYENYKVFLLKEDMTPAKPGEEGEICVAGPCLALGYYNDPERTGKSFIQNPLNTSYQERIYRTGDIGVRREDGVLEFHGRMDRQVKHMGHRVELDEIEFAANQMDGVSECCCIYQKEKEKLHLFYSGSAGKREILLELRKVLPGFMVPRGVKQLDHLPKLANGKIDMNKLKEEIR